jgi:hypothetical protein
MKFVELNAFDMILKVLGMLKSNWRHHQVHSILVGFYKSLIKHEVHRKLI